jgi:hypothetical protein
VGSPAASALPRTRRGRTAWNAQAKRYATSPGTFEPSAAVVFSGVLAAGLALAYIACGSQH